MFKRILDYFGEKIWNVKIKQLPRKTAYSITFSRILSLTAKFFVKNRCDIRASALTFFSLLSVVPVAALIFGIAKGYGYEETLKHKLRNSMIGQEEAADRIIHFADSMLKNASGTVIAGIGILLLIWTALKLLANIERSFNDIWGVKIGRSWIRKLSDYLTMLIICPVLLLIMVSSSAFAVAQLHGIAQNLPLSSAWNFIIGLSARMLPLIIAWITFIFMYFFIPNTKVKVKSALIAGIFTGTLYFALQYLYMYVQAYLSSYNAVYGSFAALPFFLIWLQASWTIVLLGAQLAFSVQNVNIYELSPGDGPLTQNDRMLCALRIVERLAEIFETGHGGLSVAEISEALEIPIRTTRAVLYELSDAGIITELMTEKNAEDRYQIALPTEQLTPLYIVRTLANMGERVYRTEGCRKYEMLLNHFWEAAEHDPENRPLGKP